MPAPPILSPADTRSVRAMLRAARTSILIARRLPSFYHRVAHDSAGIVTSRAADRAPSSPAPWCESHGRTVRECNAVDLDCRGIIVDSPDPTGNAATNRDPSRARALKAATLIRDIDIATAALLALIAPPKPSPAPTIAVLRSLANTNHLADPSRHCSLCAAIPPPGQTRGQWLVPAHRTSTVGGILSTASPLCAGHLRRVGLIGQLPSPADTLTWQETGHWPGQRTGPRSTALRTMR